MPHISLTQLGAERLRAAEREVLYWDKNMPGFGLRISPKGRKTFLVQYRYRWRDPNDGKLKLKERQETLGTLDFLTVAQARDRARQSKAKASAGIDPIAEHQAAEKAEEEERQNKTFTFAKLVERYQREYADINTKASTAEQTDRLLQRWSEGSAPKLGKIGLGDRPVRDIRKADILNFLNDLLSRKSNGKGRTEANNLLGAVQRLFEWARKRDLIEANPAKDVAKPMPRMTTRDRWLEDDEIRAFWAGCDQIGWPAGYILQLLLLTGQRSSEVAGLEWAELDLANKVWHLPARRTKNSKAHTVHLSDFAVEIIQNQPHINRSKYVFTTSGTTPYKDLTGAAQRVERLMGDVPHWRPHDLRRTATSVMARIGIAPHVADRVLNHQSGTISGVAAVYNRYEYLEERKAALEALGRFIETLIGRDSGNVVPLRQPA